MNDYTFPTIDKDTPLEEIKRIHQLIWDYCIKHGEKPVLSYLGRCVCCEHVLIHNGKAICDNCPAIWPRVSSEDPPCFDLYTSWTTAKNPKRKREIAKIIRDIPFKFEEENKNA